LLFYPARLKLVTVSQNTWQLTKNRTDKKVMHMVNHDTLAIECSRKVTKINYSKSCNS